MRIRCQRRSGGAPRRGAGPERGLPARLREGRRRWAAGISALAAGPAPRLREQWARREPRAGRGPGAPRGADPRVPGRGLALPAVLVALGLLLLSQIRFEARKLVSFKSKPET